MGNFDNFVNNRMFYNFANELEGQIDIHQFTRISNTTLMTVDIGWLFTATLFGILLGQWFGVFSPILSLIIVIAHSIYICYTIFTEIH